MKLGVNKDKLIIWWFWTQTAVLKGSILQLAFLFAMWVKSTQKLVCFWTALSSQNGWWTSVCS
jgi:hypothetical protein